MLEFTSELGVGLSCSWNGVCGRREASSGWMEWCCAACGELAGFLADWGLVS